MIWNRARRHALPAFIVLLGSGIAGAQIAPGPGVNPRTVWSQPPEAFQTRVLAEGFEDPWEVTWGADDHLWITERTGRRVVRVDPADGSRQTVGVIRQAKQSLGQDGLLGLALHPQFGRGNHFVYVMYTYDAKRGPGFLRRGKIRRYTFNERSGRLRDPFDVLANIPHGPDHGASRIAFGLDGNLYASTGDQGGNFLANICDPIRSQNLPSAAEVAAGDWRNYEGKILRIAPDGSIPDDNPLLDGVRSHVFSYGHRNPQGLAFAPDGSLYSAEHGQDTDDEVNLIEAGRNYGWPLIAGYRDDNYYAYANWSQSSPTPCDELQYVRVAPDSVPRTPESAVNLPDFAPPLMTFFTVPNSFDPAELGNATAALTGLEVYAAQGIPGWNPSLLVASLVSGTIYRIPLDGSAEAPLTYFRSRNRFRDVAVSPDGLRIFAVTSASGRTLDLDGVPTGALEHPAALLEFRYTN